ncbi:MAG: (Fe-S)-binding protein [Bacteroidetes bacterium]|nr:(Fe-S)-binding protein [Bacteroidota bacterium]
MGRLSEEKKKLGLEVLSSHEDSKLITHLNSCVHCGLCADSCIYYRSEPDEHYVPAKKVDIVASIYRRYNTFLGKKIPWLTKARDLDDATIEEMVDLLYGSCTMCGRCTMHCSIGVDINYVVRIGREMLSRMGYVPASLNASVNAAIETGNNMGIPTKEFVDTIEWLEDDLKFELNDDNANIPLNQKGKDILYTLNPREPKFFPLSISAMAKVFYAANESWSLSTEMYDVTNYAFFSGNMDEANVIAQRMDDEMNKMESKKCVLAECGHGSRAFKWEGPNYIQKRLPYEVLTSVELLAQYIREGKIKVDADRLTEVVTLHDPCNLTREGGVIEEQRYVMRKIAKNFVEMTPYGTDNLCCGGGGGQLAMSEYNTRRMKTAGLKADQIRKTGASIVVTPCHNCVDQLMQTNVEYKLNVKIMTLAELVADALILE